MRASVGVLIQPGCMQQAQLRWTPPRPVNRSLPRTTLGGCQREIFDSLATGLSLICIILIMPEPAPGWPIGTVMYGVRVSAARARHKAPIAPRLRPPVGLMQHNCSRCLLLLLVCIAILFRYSKQCASTPRGAVHVLCRGVRICVRGAAGVAEGAATKAPNVVAAFAAFDHVPAALRGAALPGLAVGNVVDGCIFC